MSWDYEIGLEKWFIEFFPSPAMDGRSLNRDEYALIVAAIETVDHFMSSQDTPGSDIRLWILLKDWRLKISLRRTPNPSPWIDHEPWTRKIFWWFNNEYVVKLVYAYFWPVYYIYNHVFPIKVVGSTNFYLRPRGWLYCYQSVYAISQ